MKLRLSVLTTHPVQYAVPWFRALAADPCIDLEVLFFRELDSVQQGVGFGQEFQWDVPLLEGYSNKVLGASTGWGNLPRLLFLVYRALRLRRPAAVLVTGWNEPGLVLAYPLLRALRIPIILRGESNALRQRPALVQLLHRVLLSVPSAVLVIGKSNRDFYLSNGTGAQRLFPGAYFVESERMLDMAATRVPDRLAARVAGGFGEDDFVFAFSGKHVAVKRPFLLVEAAALVRQRGWPVKLLFSGAGELTSDLKQRAVALGVPSHFLGFLNQTEIWRAYVPADAFVLPSNGETWGLVVNEAFLFGLPVIVSDQVGCGPDLVIEGQTGYIFSGEAAGLANAMERLLSRRADASSMGAAGRRLVTEQYSMHVATAGLKEALAAVCRCGEADDVRVGG